ncbi:ATP-dependent DNA ligase LigA [Halobaculum roseum]|uniref:DNA ligase n=1 Tax=Halobaculum roseum TaxID=2175149 RepID=A0ABD5MJM2_9EURY|nr:ATP-dependent DNA ligase LigA [Halobaculum roseum]QZY03428.1 ATP-dependent DNA ligase [Halobaculum roseum]
MDFATFAERAESMAAEPGDLATVALVAETLAAAEGDAASGSDDLPVVARFLRGAVFPGWDGRTLSVGPALCHAALARAAGANVTADDIEARLAETGEIGAVAADLDLGGQTGLAAFAGGDGAGTGDDADGAGNGNDLTVREVYDELVAVAEATGDGSESFREDTLFGLFTRASPVEAKILARLVLGEMRIGVGSGTLRDATAEAFLGASVTTPTEERDEDDRTEELVALVERALQVTNDHGRVARIARDEGEEGLREVSLSVGRPVRSMLAQSGTVADALESWEEAVVETKYDGARVQIHYEEEESDRSTGADADTDDLVSIYSRNMEDVTAALPELVEHVREHASAPAILDGEAVAVDDGGEPLPFQEILRRFRRKHDVDRMREEVRVELRAFDCLHAGGDDLLDAPLVERHDRLHEVLDEGVSELLVSDDADEIEAFEAEALSAGHEGVMLKRPESTYDPGNRGKEWLKRKPDVETLDLIVTGAEWGEGRRAELFGTFEVSVRVADGDGAPSDGDTGGDAPPDSDDGNDGRYATVGKVATGITDEELADLTDLLEPYVRSESGQRVAFAPEAVFEVGYEEIQTSPTYDSGYALRFPRFVAVREDKAPADADSLARLRRLVGAADAE